MKSLNLSGLAKRMKEPVLEIGLATGGVIAAQKFLDFKTLMPNVSPDKWFIKHEGLVKVGGVLVTMAIWKGMPHWAKWLLIGVAIQGGIKAVRTYTMGDTGKAFVEQIGDMDTALKQIAEEVKTSASREMNGIAGEGDGSTGVGNRGDGETSVGGLGWDLGAMGYVWGDQAA